MTTENKRPPAKIIQGAKKKPTVTPNGPLPDMKDILKATAHNYWNTLEGQGKVDSPEDMSVRAIIHDETGTRHTVISIDVRPWDEKRDGAIDSPTLAGNMVPTKKAKRRG